MRFYEAGAVVRHKRSGDTGMIAGWRPKGPNFLVSWDKGCRREWVSKSDLELVDQREPAATTSDEIATEVVTTDQLRPGDVVHNYGMRLEIDQEIQSYPPRHLTDNITFHTAARITNWPEVVAQAKAEPSSNAAFLVGHQPDRNAAEQRFTIQGNKLARWFREVRKA